MEKIHGNMFLCLHVTNLHESTKTCPFPLQYRSSFQSSTLIGRAVTRSQTSLDVRARFRLGFRAGYDVF